MGFEIASALSGLWSFVAYFALGAVLVTLFAFVYMKLTAHDEIALVRAGNVSAAIALGATVIGLALPVASAITNTMSILHAGLWSMIGCVVQIAAYALARALIPNLSSKIEADEPAAATMLAAVSFTAAMLNAACMTF
jgi:putative membrane protein